MDVEQRQRNQLESASQTSPHTSCDGPLPLALMSCLSKLTAYRISRQICLDPEVRASKTLSFAIASSVSVSANDCRLHSLHMCATLAFPIRRIYLHINLIAFFLPFFVPIDWHSCHERRAIQMHAIRALGPQSIAHSQCIRCEVANEATALYSFSARASAILIT